jgi:hypothetical protein
MKQFEANGRDDEQIHGGNVRRVVVQVECTIPSLAAHFALTMYLATLDWAAAKPSIWWLFGAAEVIGRPRRIGDCSISSQPVNRGCSGREDEINRSLFGVTLFTQIELKAQSVGDFVDAPLKTNRITRRGNDRRLPPVSMVFANADVHRPNAHCGDDYVRKLIGSFAFLSHRQISDLEAVACDQVRNVWTIEKLMPPF